MSSRQSLTSVSKWMSYLLRHKPEDANLHMDAHGWVSIDELSRNAKIPVSIIYDVVKTSDKQRYSISNDMIRANQGHSFPVDLDLKPESPPDILYHGTAKRFVDSIRKDGIKHMERQYVHLSDNYDTALKVGQRHGDPCVLKVRAKDMESDGITFYHSVNGVWLTDYVDSRYLC